MVFSLWKIHVIFIWLQGSSPKVSCHLLETFHRIPPIEKEESINIYTPNTQHQVLRWLLVVNPISARLWSGLITLFMYIEVPSEVEVENLINHFHVFFFKFFYFQKYIYYFFLIFESYIHRLESSSILIPMNLIIISLQIHQKKGKKNNFLFKKKRKYAWKLTIYSLS